MPQLMPLMWVTSIMMFTLLMMVLFDLYFYIYSYNFKNIGMKYNFVKMYKW